MTEENKLLRQIMQLPLGVFYPAGELLGMLDNSFSEGERMDVIARCSSPCEEYGWLTLLFTTEEHGEWEEDLHLFYGVPPDQIFVGFLRTYKK